MKFIKKPIIIEAVKWDGEEETFNEIILLNKLNREIYYTDADYVLKIDTLEGIHDGQIGDWIIQGVNGELYPCKPDIFEKTYEPLTPPQS